MGPKIEEFAPRSARSGQLNALVKVVILRRTGVWSMATKWESGLAFRSKTLTGSASSFVGLGIFRQVLQGSEVFQQRPDLRSPVENSEAWTLGGVIRRG